MKINPIMLEVLQNKFSSIAEEMGVTLGRTAFSANIKERKDFSCALFDGSGDMIAQAAHIPVHLGSMPLSVKAAIAGGDLAEGDMVMLNDPFRGGTHLPDITVVAPVFTGHNSPSFFVANRAHHADVGGMSPGSMPLSTCLFQEGIVIPPVKIVETGRIDDKLMRFLLSNVRTPSEREGDFAAQIMANHTGVSRMLELVGKYGRETVQFYAEGLMDHAEMVMRKTIEAIPDGVYRFEDRMHDDGLGAEDVKVRVTVEIAGDRAEIDFTASDAQVKGSINAVRAITVSAVLYVFRSLVKEQAPTNEGCLRPLSIRTRRGTVVDAEFPAAVAGGNVETSQRIVDVLLGALAQALPGDVPAASQGTMNNLVIGGYDPQRARHFTYYETIAGGMGATAVGAGERAVHSHMTNTLNTPVEALEYAFPFLVREYSIRKGSGGDGRFRGGDGVVREIQLLCDAEVTVLSERRGYPPYGLCGGGPAAAGRNLLIKKGVRCERPGKFREELNAADVIRIETPGGGGYGKAE